MKYHRDVGGLFTVAETPKHGIRYLLQLLTWYWITSSVTPPKLSEGDVVIPPQYTQGYEIGNTIL